MPRNSVFVTLLLLSDIRRRKTEEAAETQQHRAALVGQTSINTRSLKTFLRDRQIKFQSPTKKRRSTLVVLR